MKKNVSAFYLSSFKDVFSWGKEMKRDGTSMRVLVVDDEPLIRSGLYRLFENSAEVKAVGSAEEAIVEIGAQHYDLCFLDYVLPGMNGLDALKIINELSSNTKVAIMSGSYLDEAEKSLIEAAAFVFIEKPFEISHIREIAKKVDDARSSKGRDEDIPGLN